MKFDKVENFKPPIPKRPKNTIPRKVAIHVINSNHSREIQEYCFAHGIAWLYGRDKVIQYTDQNYLFIYPTEKDLTFSHANRDNVPVVSFRRLQDIIGEVCPA